jgi:hypothetical protein
MGRRIALRRLSLSYKSVITESHANVEVQANQKPIQHRKTSQGVRGDLIGRHELKAVHAWY